MTALVPQRALGTTRLWHLVASLRRRGAELHAVDLAQALVQTGLGQTLVVADAARPEIALPPSLPVVTLGRSPNRLAAAWALRRLLRHAPPDIVICHGLQLVKLLLLASVGLRRPRVIYRKISMTAAWIGAFGRTRMALNRLVLARIDAAVAIGPHQAEEVIADLGVPPAKVFVIPPGLTLPLTLPAAVRAPAQLLVLGAVDEPKQPLVALAVLRGVRGQGVPATLTFVGDGPLRAAVAARAEAWGLTPHVTFAGLTADVWPHLASATLLLMTSRTEGVPAAAIEAGHCGLPVAAYAVGDLAVAVRHGETGLLVPPGDQAGLIAACVALLTDPSLRKHMGEAGRRHAAQFDISATVQRYRTLLTAVTPAASPAPR